MAKSIRSKSRRKNKQVMRAKLKPKFDSQLASIVKNLQEETGQQMETAGHLDLSNHVQIMDENKEPMEMDTDGAVTKLEIPKIKIPKVDIKNVSKFMSQRKLRTYRAKLKAQKKQQKHGQKKKKDFKW